MSPIWMFLNHTLKQCYIFLLVVHSTTILYASENLLISSLEDIKYLSNVFCSPIAYNYSYHYVNLKPFKYRSKMSQRREEKTNHLIYIQIYLNEIGNEPLIVICCTTCHIVIAPSWWPLLASSILSGYSLPYSDPTFISEGPQTLLPGLDYCDFSNILTISMDAGRIVFQMFPFWHCGVPVQIPLVALSQPS